MSRGRPGGLIFLFGLALPLLCFSLFRILRRLIFLLLLLSLRGFLRGCARCSSLPFSPEALPCCGSGLLPFLSFPFSALLLLLLLLLLVLRGFLLVRLLALLRFIAGFLLRFLPVLRVLLRFFGVFFCASAEFRPLLLAFLIPAAGIFLLLRLFFVIRLSLLLAVLVLLSLIS